MGSRPPLGFVIELLGDFFEGFGVIDIAEFSGIVDVYTCDRSIDKYFSWAGVAQSEKL